MKKEITTCDTCGKEVHLDGIRIRGRIDVSGEEQGGIIGPESDEDFCAKCFSLAMTSEFRQALKKHMQDNEVHIKHTEF